MNLYNTVVLFGVGFAMELLPRLKAEAVDSETRALWLMAMGAVTMAIGGAYLVRMAWETLPRERYFTAVRAALREEDSAEPVHAETDGKARTHA